MLAFKFSEYDNDIKNAIQKVRSMVWNGTEAGYHRGFNRTMKENARDRMAAKLFEFVVANANEISPIDRVTFKRSVRTIQEHSVKATASRIEAKKDVSRAKLNAARNSIYNILDNLQVKRNLKSDAYTIVDWIEEFAL